MTRKAPSLPGLPTAKPVEHEISAATEALFAEIAEASGSSLLLEAVAMINARLHAVRPYESAVIPNLQAEYEAMAKAWEARDIPRLRALTLDYFDRRRAIAPQLINLINRPN